LTLEALRLGATILVFLLGVLDLGDGCFSACQRAAN